MYGEDDTGRSPLCYVWSACRQVNSAAAADVIGQRHLFTVSPRPLRRSPLCWFNLVLILLFTVYLRLSNVLRRRITSVVQRRCGVEASIIFRSWPQKLGFYCRLKTHWTLCSCLFCYAASSQASCVLCEARRSRFSHRSPATGAGAVYIKSALPQTSPRASHANVLPPAHTRICTPAAFLRITAVQQPAELQGAGLLCLLSSCLFWQQLERKFLSFIVCYVCV